MVKGVACWTCEQQVQDLDPDRALQGTLLLEGS